jgi:hypothetical protein
LLPERLLAGRSYLLCGEGKLVSVQATIRWCAVTSGWVMFADTNIDRCRVALWRGVLSLCVPGYVGVSRGLDTWLCEEGGQNKRRRRERDWPMLGRALCGSCVWFVVVTAVRARQPKQGALPRYSCTSIGRRHSPLGPSRTSRPIHVPGLSAVLPGEVGVPSPLHAVRENTRLNHRVRVPSLYNEKTHPPRLG